MRILSKYNPRRKVAKKRQERSSREFDDIIVVGDREEKADLIDIEEVPGTRGEGKSVLDAKGQFIYEVDFLIDAEDAIAESVTAVEIIFLRDSPRRRPKARGKSQQDIRDRFKRKKKRRNKRRESDTSAVRSRRNIVVSRAIVSLGEEFVESAQLKSQLERINNSIERAKDRIPKSRVVFRTAKPKKDGQIRNIKMSKTHRHTQADDYLFKTKSKSGIATKKKIEKSGEKTSKKRALKIVTKKGVSPLQIGKAIHPTTPLFISESRDSRTQSARQKKKIHKNTRKVSVKEIKRTKSALSSKKSFKKIQQQQEILRAQRSFLNRLNRKKDEIEEELAEVSFETRMIPYSCDVGLNIRRVGDKENFYMVVRLIHDKRTRGRSKIYKINHKEQLDEILTPDESPELSAGVIGNKPNEIRIRITQNDDIASSVNLLRRKITDDVSDEESRFRQIAEVKVHAETGTASYIDHDVANVDPVSYEYRAIPVGPTGSEGVEHSASVIVKGIKPIGSSASRYADPDANIAISAVNNYDRVSITVESIPEDVVGVRLFKEDLISDSFFSNSENRYKPVIPPGLKTGVIEVGKGETSVFIEDVDVVPDRTYRYKCVLRRLRQPEIEGNDEEVIHYIKPRVRTPIEASIENIETRLIDDNVEVKFELSAEFSDPGLELLGDIFTASGISGNFIEDIRKNRDQLQEVPAFLVSRVDLYTGRSVLMGLFAPGEFHDSLALQKKVGSYMVAGRKYRYIARLSIRPPEAFFKNAVTSIDVQNKGLLDLSETERYEVLSQRFLSGFGATSGLVSDSELKNLSEKGLMGQFELGKTGVELEETIKTPAKETRVTSARVHPRRRDNIVRWTTTGDPFRINMYVIVLNFKGTRGVLGTVPSRNSSVNYFRDKLYYAELGDISYDIYPVYNDMRVGKPVKTNTISRDREVSDELLNRMIQRKAEKETEDNER